jgi:hypothetical protein
MKIYRNKETCDKTIEFANTLGMYDYHTCGNPIKYKVEYTDIRGKRVKDEMCGIHFNSLKKWAERLKKKTSFDPDLILLD